jgi:hypothetical protein
MAHLSHRHRCTMAPPRLAGHGMPRPWCRGRVAAMGGPSGRSAKQLHLAARMERDSRVQLICKHMCTYINYTYTHTYIYVYIYIYVLYIYIHTYIYIHIYIYWCTNVKTYLSIVTLWCFHKLGWQVIRSSRIRYLFGDFWKTTQKSNHGTSMEQDLVWSRDVTRNW